MEVGKPDKFLPVLDLDDYGVNRDLGSSRYPVRDLVPSGRLFESHWVFARMEMTRAASHKSSLASPAASFGYQRSQWYSSSWIT